MQVYGDLILLPEDGSDIPLPWHCRAPLGLKGGVQVHVTLVDPPNNERLPDIVLTTIPPESWSSARILRIRHVDQPGILHRVLDLVRQLNEEQTANAKINIALGESATLGIGGKGRLHDICLLCEQWPAGPGSAATDSFDRLKKQLEREGCEPDFRPLEVPGAVREYFGCYSVDHGKVKLASDWRQHVLRRWSTSGFDMRLAAVTADLDARLIRLVVPRHGAKRLVSHHQDAPNVLVRLTDAVRRCGYNILCSHCRLGDGGERTATLVAVCEPSSADRAEPGIELERIEQSLEIAAEDPVTRTVKSIGIHDAVPWRKSLYPRLPEAEVINQFRSLVENRADKVEPLQRHDLLRSVLKLAGLPSLSESLVAAAAPLEPRYKRGLHAYVSTGCDGTPRDFFDDYIRRVLDEFKIRAVHDADACGETSLASRVPLMRDADLGIFVVRCRHSPSGGEWCCWRPLQEHAVFHSLWQNRRSLLLIEDAACRADARFHPPELDADRSHTRFQRFSLDLAAIESAPDEEWIARTLNTPMCPFTAAWSWLRKLGN